MRHAAIVALGPFFAMVIWLAIQVSDRSPPITDAHTWVTRSGPSGTAIHVQAVIFYRRSCEAHITRTLYDARGTAFPAPLLSLPPGKVGIQVSSSDIPIPVGFADGEARAVSSPAYGCNWFQRVFWPIRMPDRVARFKVEPAPGGGLP